LTTSMGVLPYTEAAPAIAPNTPTTGLGMCFLESPSYSKISATCMLIGWNWWMHPISIHFPYSMNILGVLTLEMFELKFTQTKTIKCLVLIFLDQKWFKSN